MYLVELLLPLPRKASDTAGRQLKRVRKELVDRFGGVTAHVRSPAKGLWRDTTSGEVVPDEIVSLEVMTPELDRAWWSGYRAELERRLKQDEILIRAHSVEQL